VSLWGVHVGFAGVVTVLAVLAIAPGYRYRWHLLAASAGWAILPDFHHVLVFTPRLQRHWKAVLHDSALADLFWLHRVIDRLDPGDRVEYSVAMWALLVVVVVGAELVVRQRAKTT
jgi:hypothetical protein